MRIGATYSHREIASLKLDSDKSFQTALDMHFDILRLGIYWDESEPKSGQYNFESIENLLTQSDQAGQPVLLSVGMKAPRWPEYFIPKWLHIEHVHQAKNPVQKFIKTAVTQLKHHPSIVAWQVENEPLDGSGPKKWRIPESLLTQEVKLVRHLDPSRQIHINLWGDNITRSSDFKIASTLADTVGIDLYYKQPAANNAYHGPNFNHWQFKLWRLKQRIRRQAKPIWITELQTEPWEHSNNAKFQPNTPSLTSDQLIQNFHQAQKLNPEIIFFWGLEYWLWRANQGSPDLFNAAKTLITPSNHPRHIRQVSK